MKYNDDLNWTEQFGQIQLLSKVDELTLQVDMLRSNCRELKEESNLWENAYRKLLKEVTGKV